MPNEPKVVYDTSSLVPAHLRRVLVRAALARQSEAYWSPWIIAELVRILSERWMRRVTPWTRKDHQEMSDACGAMMRHMIQAIHCENSPAPSVPSWNGSDPNDEPVLALAQMVKARYVVSENVNDFPPKNSKGQHTYGGIEYMRVNDFLHIIHGTHTPNTVAP